MTDLTRLSELASKLPRGLQSDWEWSNHFELTSSEEEYWWLFPLQLGIADHADPANSEDGKKIGLLMDIAEEVARLRDEGVFENLNKKAK